MDIEVGGRAIMPQPAKRRCGPGTPAYGPPDHRIIGGHPKKSNSIVTCIMSSVSVYGEAQDF
jgi:hypothetical protein